MTLLINESKRSVQRINGEIIKIIRIIFLFTQNKIYRKLITSLGNIDDMTDEQISSGFYWSYPGKASLSIGIRYIDSKRYLNTKEGSVLSTKYQVASGRGNRLSVDYSF